MFAAVLFLLFGAAAGDKTLTAAGVTVKVQGQSGKMTLTVPTTSGTMDVVAQMVALRQLDASDNALGGGGNEKHSFNSFATQSFTFGNPTEGMYKNISVAKVSFQSVLVGSSTVKIDTFIFKEAGTFMVGNDMIQVPMGAVKFNVELSSWAWCGGNVKCKNGAGDGASVEVDLSVMAKGNAPTKKQGSTNGFDLGEGKQLLMLNTYTLDGSSTLLQMPSGYPKASGSTFTLRFPRWTGILTYDPIVSSSLGGGSAATSGTSVTSGGQVSAAESAGLTKLFPVLLLMSSALYKLV